MKVNKTLNFNILLINFIIVTSFFVSIYIGLNEVPRKGLEFLWSLPFIFSIILIIFNNTLKFHRNGIGLKVLYIILFIRYVLSPLFITLSQGYIAWYMISASEDGYKYAIFTSLIELITVFLTLKLFYKRIESKNDNYKNMKGISNLKTLNFGGVILFSLLLFIILARGLDNALSTFSFISITEKYTNSVVDSYSVTAIQVLKSFLYISFLVLFYKKFQKSKRKLWIYLAVLITFFNVSTYFGYNRSIILQTGLASVYSLFYAFPKFKRRISVVLIPSLLFVLLSLITLKQFGTSINDFKASNLININEVSVILENYIGGMWPNAISFDIFRFIQDKMNAGVFIKDIIDNFFLFKVPGFNFVSNYISNIDSTINLYQYYTLPALGAMLPNAGLMLFYGGYFFGSILTVISTFLTTYLLIGFDIKSRNSDDFYEVFVNNWLAVLFGLFLCYCPLTLLWSYSKFAFFIQFMIFINHKFIFYKKEGLNYESTLGL